MEGCDETDSDTLEAMQRWQNRWACVFTRTRYNWQKNLLPLERRNGVLCAYKGYMKRLKNRKRLQEYVINTSAFKLYINYIYTHSCIICILICYLSRIQIFFNNYLIKIYLITKIGELIIIVCIKKEYIYIYTKVDIYK